LPRPSHRATLLELLIRRTSPRRAAPSGSKVVSRCTREGCRKRRAGADDPVDSRSSELQRPRSEVILGR
jgi:hypothetical protein